jgi:hypothetical protein
MKKHNEKLSEVHKILEIHLNDNVLDPVLKIFTGENFNKFIDATLNSSNSLFSSYKCGVADLPNVDNFFFPQELYANLNNYTLPIEAIPGLMPSVGIRKCTQNFLYSKFKLAKIDVDYTPSNVFMASSNFVKNTIEEGRAYNIPKHICFLYYPQIINDDLLVSENHSSEPIDLVKSIRYYLWLFFPVSKATENKYTNEVKHKIKYPDLQADLTIRISVTYDLTYEELSI